MTDRHSVQTLRLCGTEMRLMRKVGCQAVPWDVLSGQRGPGAGPRGWFGGECGARGGGGLRAALSAAGGLSDRGI